MQLARNAYALLFTSQGRVIFQQGCEAGRSKPLQVNDPYPDIAHTSPVVVAENGVKYFHENSYSSPDVTNRFDWERKNDFKELTDYVRGLIEIRKSLPGLRFTEANSIRNGLRFFPQYMNGVLVYMIDNNMEQNSTNVEKILVIHNGEPDRQEIKLAEISNLSDWSIMADCKRAGMKPFVSSSVTIINGSVSVAGSCSPL